MNRPAFARSGQSTQSIISAGLKRHKLAMAIAATCIAPTAAAQLEEIVVTATKRSELVTDLAQTVNVVTGNQLDEFKIFQFEDMEKMAPGLDLETATPRSWSVSLRGAPYNPDSSAEPTVVTYWNGLKVYPNAAFAQLYDISRIEVLRGAQGTVQGATSPSGAIQIHTQQADGAGVHGYVRQNLVSGGNSLTEGAVNLPLMDGMAGVRIAGVYSDEDRDARSAASGQKGYSRTQGGRISFFAAPTDRLDLSLTYDYLEVDADALTTVEGRDLLGNGNPTLEGNDRRSLEDASASVFRRNQMANLTVNYALDNHTLTLVSGYLDLWQSSQRDTDFGNIFPDYELPTVTESGYEVWSHELRLASDFGGFWDYIIGAYYFDSQTDTTDRRFSPTLFSRIPGALPSQPGVPGMPTLGLVDSLSLAPADNKTESFFVANEFNLSDTLQASAGLRWQRNELFRNVTTLAGSDVVFSPEFVLPGGTVLASIPEQFQTYTDEAVTGSLGLSWDMTPEVMVYGSYARSYRPGGSVMEPTVGVDPSLIVYNEETSDNLELGFKYVSADNRLQVSGAAYYQQFDGFIQRNEGTVLDLNGDGILDTSLSGGTNFNADAVIRGMEFEGRALLADNWDLFFSSSYNDAKFDDAAVPCGNIGDAANPGSQLRTCSTDGRMGTAPNLSATVSSEYRFPGLVAGNDAYIRGLVRYVGSREDDNAAFNPVLYDGYRVKSYSTWDLYAGLQAPDQRWELSLWARNLFDREATNALGKSHAVSGTNAVLPGAPAQTLFSGYSDVTVIPARTVGVTATWRFGD
ncbi:MAG: hypothetical protein CME38_19510 [Haliea sp.]|nr:hypothetical protein [Haliea sp.]|tara:strand:+ start:7441 stop:9846 length:2406 start_codon:yes stop_codon:yes gene_type:complete